MMRRVECEVWSRVTGYFRPYSQYNKGMKSQYDERKKLKIPVEVTNAKGLIQVPTRNP